MCSRKICSEPTSRFHGKHKHENIQQSALVVAAISSVALAACSGGGGGNNSQGGNSIGWNATPDWIDKPGGSGSSGGNPDPATPSGDKNNTVAIRVDNSMGTINMLSATITVCVPGTQGASQCTTIDRMLVDTG